MVSVAGDEAEGDGKDGLASVYEYGGFPFHRAGDAYRQAGRCREAVAAALPFELRSVVAHLHGAAAEIDFDLAHLGCLKPGLQLQRLEHRDRSWFDRELDLTAVGQFHDTGLPVEIAARQRQRDVGFRVEQRRQLVSDTGEGGDCEQDGCVEQQILGHQVGCRLMFVAAALFPGEQGSRQQRKSDSGRGDHGQNNLTQIIRPSRSLGERGGVITRDSLVQKPDRLGQVLHELSGEMCVFSFVEGLLERILRLFAALRQRPDDCLEPAGSHNPTWTGKFECPANSSILWCI